MRLAVALFLFVACSPLPPSQPDANPFVCEVMAPTGCPTPALAYADVQPIFSEHCTAVCHQGRPGETWSLKDYVHVYDWQDDIRGDVTSCAMPPYDGGVAMPTAQREKILGWLRCGAPP